MPTEKLTDAQRKRNSIREDFAKWSDEKMEDKQPRWSHAEVMKKLNIKYFLSESRLYTILREED